MLDSRLKGVGKKGKVAAGIRNDSADTWERSQRLLSVSEIV